MSRGEQTSSAPPRETALAFVSIANPRARGEFRQFHSRDLDRMEQLASGEVLLASIHLSHFHSRPIEPKEDGNMSRKWQARPV